MAPWLILSALVLTLDQGTKHLAELYLIPYRPLIIAPSFNLTLVYNEGAAFSFLSDAGGWQRWLLSALAVLMSLVLGVWLVRLRRGERTTAIALALVIGGALGNLVDRILTGKVVDFIQVYYQTWYWPAFNIADSAISVGVVLLLITGFRERRVEDRR